MVHQPAANPNHQGLLLEWLQTSPNNFMNMNSRLKLGTAFESAKNRQDILQLLASTARQKQYVPTNTIYRNGKTKPYHPFIRFHYADDWKHSVGLNMGVEWAKDCSGNWAGVGPYYLGGCRVAYIGLYSDSDSVL